MSNSCDLMGCSLPGSSVHGILQSRLLEWAAIPFSRGIFSTQGVNPGLLQILYLLSHQGSPRRTCCQICCCFPILHQGALLRAPLRFCIDTGVFAGRTLVSCAVCCAWLLSHVQLFVTAWTVALQAPLSIQARIMEGVAMPSSRVSSRPRDQTQLSHITGRFFTV